MFTEGRVVIKKMFSFRNIQIRVDGALMFNATLCMYNPTCYEFGIHFPFIFPSSCCFSLVFLFLPLLSLVVGYNFFVCFFLPNVFGTVISGVSCTLANNCAKLFCTGGEHLFEDGFYSNVYSTCVPFNLKKDPLPYPLLSSVVQLAAICALFLSLCVKLVRFSYP